VVDARSDAWGLGATLYALLAGRPPFFGSDDESDLDILARVVRDDIADIRTIAPTTSAGTAALLQQLLHRDAAQRPELHSVATTLDDIAATLASGDLPAAPATAVTAPNVAVVDQASAVDVVEPVVEPAVEPAVAGLSSGLLLFVGLNVVVAIAAALVLVRWYFAEPTVVERVVERVVEVPAKPVVTTPPPIVVDLTPPTPPAPTPAPDVPTPIEALPLPALVADTSTAAGERLFSIAVSADTLGDDVVNAVADSARTDIDAILEGAIRSTHSPRRRQLAAVELLRQRRNDRALSVLMSVANAHPDSAVRRAAGEARDSIFKVE
jgi:serine/threonine-protein kinase